MTKEDYAKYYIQGSDHYLVPSDIFNELIDEMINWREDAKTQSKENKILKENAENNDKAVDKVNWNNKLLKQSLIDISNLVKKDSIEIDGKYTEACCSGDDILQIIDEVLDLDKVRR